MSAHKGIENRLDKIIEAIDRLTKAVERAVERAVEGKTAIEKEVRTSDPRICGAVLGRHLCDLPSGHMPRHQHYDSTQPPGYNEFSL